MGLDTLDLFMETEERFGIQLCDKEFTELQSVGQLHDLIYQLHNVKYQEGTCAMQKAFHELRTALVAELGLREKEITPQTLTQNVFSETNRSQQWDTISKTMELRFPKLVLPQKLRSIISVLSFCFWISIIVLFVGFFFLLKVPFLFWKVLLLFFILLFCIVLIMLLENSHIAKEIPDSCYMIEDLTRFLIAKNPDRYKPYTQQDIWEILKYMIAEHSGLEMTKIQPETSFIEIFPYG